MDISAIILTGGKNLRMGRNKALELIAGKSLLQRVYDRVRPISREVIVVTSSQFPEVPVNGNIRVVTDVYPDKGPLGGIFSGVTASVTEKNLVVGCDMPFLNSGLLGYMAELSADYDAVVPELDDGMREPLHAVYSKHTMETAKDHLERGILSIHPFLARIKVRFIGKDEILKFDPALLTFFDINYPADLEKASLIARATDEAT